MFEITICEYVLSYCAQPPPTSTGGRLAETFDLDLNDPYSDTFYLDVAREGDGVLVSVLQSYSPSSASGFNPGVLLVNETDTLFIGAGERLLCYDLKEPRRLWEECSNFAGFWHWLRCGEFVVMQAELELAVWTTRGEKLWTAYMEPPHYVRVERDRLFVDADCLNRKRSFTGEVSLTDGPPQ